MPGKNRRNRGWFRRGIDPRRHQLTEDERRRGGLNNVLRHYFGGQYARSLGQGLWPHEVEGLDELAAVAGDGDRPGTRPRGRRY